jgi:4-hydroxy-3-methylbut-2-enyl diphosphate reductase
LREKARARQLHTIDATCPLVTKVHIEALKFAREGYNIILIGHEGHDEVLGTMGEAPESITLVENADEVDQLGFPTDAKISYLTQTTLSVNEAADVIERLKQRYPNIVAPPNEDICYATTNRQEAIQTLAPQADVVIVLGSQNSSNSRRLMEIGQSCDKQAILIDGIDAEGMIGNSVESLNLTGSETILITAGASAPENVVQECVNYFVEKFAATVEEVTIREEHVHFPLPKELRVLQTK